MNTAPRSPPRSIFGKSTRIGPSTRGSGGFGQRMSTWVSSVKTDAPPLMSPPRSTRSGSARAGCPEAPRRLDALPDRVQPSAVAAAQGQGEVDVPPFTGARAPLAGVADVPGVVP